MSIFKKLGKNAPSEGMVEKAVDAANSVTPGLGNKLMIAIVSAVIGTITTWGMAIDQRVHDLTAQSATQAEMGRMEDKIYERLRDISSMLVELNRNFSAHLEQHKKEDGAKK